MDIRQDLGQGVENTNNVTQPMERASSVSLQSKRPAHLFLTGYLLNGILFPNWPFGRLSCLTCWSWIVNMVFSGLCSENWDCWKQNVRKRREAMWCKSIQALQSGLHALILAFISHGTLNVFLSLSEPLCFHLKKKKKERIVVFNLIEFNKGLDKIRCEATFIDFEI